MSQTSQVLSEHTIGMLTAGMSTRAVARELNVNFSSISRLQRHFREIGSTSKRPHNCRPRVTTPAQDLHIQHLLLQDRLKPAARKAAAKIGLHNQRISAQTIRNRLREAHLHARRPHRGLKLTAVHHRNRLEWANAHIRWHLALWRGVLFTDESRGSQGSGHNSWKLKHPSSCMASILTGHVTHWACLGCPRSAYTTAFSTSCQYPATSHSHWTGHNPQPDQLYAKEMCEANSGHTRYWLAFGPPLPNTVKLHILEWPFIVDSLRHTCAIIMLSNQHLDMPHLWGGWIISAKEKCSLTQI